MSLQNTATNAGFLILHIRGELKDLKDFKKRCRFTLTEDYLTNDGFSKSIDNVKDWSVEKCKEILAAYLYELEITEEDIIRKL